MHRFCVISAGETGKSCREFPVARPACRGTPEIPADNIGRGCSVDTDLCARKKDFGPVLPILCALE